MEKSKRKVIETKLRLAISDILRNIEIGAAIKSEKLVKKYSKEIARKFSKTVGKVKKKLAVAKPLRYKRVPLKNKMKVAVKKTKKSN